MNSSIQGGQGRVSHCCKLRKGSATRLLRDGWADRRARAVGQSERQTACHACSVHGHYARSQGCTVKVRFEKETSWGTFLWESSKFLYGNVSHEKELVHGNTSDAGDVKLCIASITINSIERKYPRIWNLNFSIFDVVKKRTKRPFGLQS